MTTLKAYHCLIDPDGEPYTALIHGETRSKARWRAYRCDPSDPDDFKWFMQNTVLTHMPLLDDKPITYENALAADFQYEDYDQEPDADGNRFITPEKFTTECDCPLCKEVK
jgi:hypothetical protein